MSKGKKASNILVYALMAALIAGLGGFGISNFSGGGTTIATVGEREITAEEYYRALMQAMRAEEAAGATDLSFAAMEAQGIPAQVRGQLAGIAALNDEADRLGLSVGDEEVARQITTSSAFAGVDAQFDREAYEYMLDQNGWNVSQFETSVRDESARHLLQGAVSAGVAPPQQTVDLLTEWFGERRSFSWVAFDAAGLAGDVPDPTDADLEAFHAENEAVFTLPESKRLTYALLTPDMMVGSIEVDEEAMRELYAERMDQYVIPERRLVERLVFGTAEEATAAKQAIDSGESNFAAQVEARDLTLADVDLGDVTHDDLGQAADAVFGLSEPGIVGPYPTDLGPALFRMNAILAAQKTAFEEASDELRSELGRERARRAIEDLISDYDDRLAGGATLEDLTAETGMELGSIDYYAGVDADIAGYEAFRTNAEAVTEKDFPQIEALDDGGIFAIRLDETLRPRLQPLEDVREQVAERWVASQALELARDNAQSAVAQLDVGGNLGDGGAAVETAEAVTRAGFAASGAPLDLADVVFGMEPGASDLLDLPSAVLLIRLDKVEAADATDPQIAQLAQQIQAQASQAISADLFTYYAQSLLATAGISIDDAGLNAVHSQLFR